MKLADLIAIRLMDFAKGHDYDIAIPNFYFGAYEMDLFVLKKSGYVVEYEIKISRSDFFADFKKERKHIGLVNGKSRCNRFYYVVPKELVSKSEVPKYAGLIWAEKNSNGSIFFKIVKNAPTIHKIKVDTLIYRELAHKLSFREQNYRYKYNQIRDKKIFPSR